MQRGSQDRREDRGELLVSEAQIAARWNCSRSSVRRVLEAARVPVYFLSGLRRGLRRYRLADIRDVEERTQADAR